MILPFFGLSVFFHILLIVSALVLNKLRGRGLQPAYQTQNMNGGWIHSKFFNSVISYVILTVVFAYMSILTITAVAIALRIGTTEQQSIFYESITRLVLSSNEYSLAIFAISAAYLLVAKLPAKQYISLPTKLEENIAVVIDKTYAAIMWFVEVGYLTTSGMSLATPKKKIHLTTYKLKLIVISLITVSVIILSILP